MILVVKLDMGKFCICIPLPVLEQLTTWRQCDKFYTMQPPVAKFLVPDRGDVVDSGKGLSYRTARISGGPVRQPYARVDYIPQSGTKNLASGSLPDIYVKKA